MNSKMNSKQILLVALTLVPAVMNGADRDPYTYNAHFTVDTAYPDTLPRNHTQPLKQNATPAEFQALFDRQFPKPTQDELRDAMAKVQASHKEAYVPAGNDVDVARGIKTSMDRMINPPSSEPSFLSKFGNQLGFSVALTCASLIAAMLIKKFLTPKSERDRENTQTTVTEQTILNNLKSEIEQLSQNLPIVENNLKAETDSVKIEYWKMVITHGQEVLQRKIALFKALSQKFDQDQVRRYADQLMQKPAPAA